MSDTRAYPPRTNWNISLPAGKNASLYAVALIDLQDVAGSSLSKEINNSQGSLDDLAFLEFGFNVNPKSMNLDEPAAATITPTQDGGQFIEHQGQIYKNISITGTTGLRPNRDTSGGIIPIAGVVNPFFGKDIDSKTGLPRGERTGFDDFMDLRNLFRRYWDLKRDADMAHRTIMVWQNGKEGEYYVVEPMTFKSGRDASSPVTMTYEIMLRTIERLDVRNIKRVVDSYTKRNGVDTFLQRISDARRQMIFGFQIATSYVDRAVSMGQAAFTNVLQPVNDVLQALTGIVNSGKRVFNIPRNSLAVVAANAIDLATALDNASTAYKNFAIIDPIEQSAWAYRLMARQLCAVAAEDQLFTTPLSTNVAAKQKAYSNPLTGLPNTGGSPTDLGNTRATNGAAAATVLGGETIYTASLRLLGDAAKWKVLVILNNLKQPYISPAGDGVNVLRPGDEILYPSAVSVTATAIQPQGQRFSGVSPLAQRLGRDLQLQAIQADAGVVLYDVTVDAGGDLGRIDGFVNMTQAVNIKFETEQGELPTHPQFGISFPIGAKGKNRTLIGFQMNARGTLLSDSRIDTVDQLQVTTSGNVLNVSGTVTLKGANETLALDYSVRR